MGDTRSIKKGGLSYTGIFDIKEILSTVIDFSAAKGYEYTEKSCEELITENGKQVTVKLFPSKIASDYTKTVIKIIVFAKNVKEVVVEHDGRKRNMSQGYVKLAMEVFLVTDWEGSMNNRPFYFFVREFMDRFIYRNYTDKAKAIALADFQHLTHDFRKYFNMST